MRLSQVPAFLRAAAPGVKLFPSLLPHSWTPFPDATGSNFRRVHLFDMEPIGRGGFGIVFAVAIEIHTSSSSSSSSERVVDPIVALVAMKMVPILKDHCIEVINGLAANDLVRSGCTPSIARFVDAFCLSTTSPETRCEMPDVRMPGWEERLWKPFDRFIYDRRNEITSHLGESALKHTNHDQKTARLNGGATLGFIFTELSTRVLFDYKTVRSSGNVVKLEDEQRDERSHGLTTSKKMCQYTLLQAQAIDALHAGGFMHCDVHGGNFVPNTTVMLRTSDCLLMAASTMALREQFFGPRAHNPVDINDSVPLLLRVSDDPEHNRSLLKLDSSAAQPMVIDLGAGRTMQFLQCTATRATVGEFVFGPRATYEQRMSIPAYIISQRAPAYDDLHALRKDFPSTTPGLVILSVPKTHIYARPPEQLNPLVVKGVVASNDIPAGCRYVVMHSEASDGWSLGTAVCETILSFSPFGNILKASIGARSAASFLGNTTVGTIGRQRGAHIQAVTSPTSPLLTSSIGKRHTPTGLSSSSGAFGDKIYELCHTPYPTRVRLAHAEARSGSISPPSSFLTGSSGLSSSSGVSSSDEALLAHVFNVAPDYPITELVEYFKEMTAQAPHADNAFYGFSPQNPSGPWGKDDCELREVCTAIMARIAAVGLPQVDAVDGLKGTFLHRFFLKQLENKDRMKRRGWLYPALMDTLTHKWLMEYAHAKELATILVDMLAWDPSMRPPVRKLMRCSVYSDYFACSEREMHELDPDTAAVWSSIRPTARNTPSSFRDSYAFTGEVPQPNLVRMIQCPLPEAQMRYSMMDWTIGACWNVASFRALRREHMVNACFMLKLSHRLPTLLPQDAGLAAVFNCLTGVLDCYSGKVCVTVGLDKRAIALTDLGTNLLFENETSQAAYMRRLQTLLDANNPVASWPFVTDADLAGPMALMTIGSPSTSPSSAIADAIVSKNESPSKKRPRDDVNGADAKDRSPKRQRVPTEGAA